MFNEKHVANEPKPQIETFKKFTIVYEKWIHPTKNKIRQIGSLLNFLNNFSLRWKIADFLSSIKRPVFVKKSQNFCD